MSHHNNFLAVTKHGQIYYSIVRNTKERVPVTVSTRHICHTWDQSSLNALLYNLKMYISIYKIDHQRIFWGMYINLWYEIVKLEKSTVKYYTSGWKLVKAKLECTQLAVWGNKSRPFWGWKKVKMKILQRRAFL